MDPRGTEFGHDLEAFDKRLAGLFDYEQIQVAFGIGLAASSRAEKNDLLWVILLERVEQRSVVGLGSWFGVASCILYWGQISGDSILN